MISGGKRAVLFDGLIFLVREFSRFLHNGIRYADLADIVQLCRPLHIKISLVDSVMLLKSLLAISLTRLLCPLVYRSLAQQVGEHLHTRHHEAVILFPSVSHLRTLIGGPLPPPPCAAR